MNCVVKRVNEYGYSGFVLWLSSESLLDNLNDIENALRELDVQGQVLIDQLFLTGDGYNRFLSCDFKGGKLDLRAACIVEPIELFCKETTRWLHDNYSYIENSILTESQRRQIRDG